ncbi:MAG: hypothetical protein GKS01_10760 [Alphaproteobacteria bacterium]|nr:hypothetical protein [Alphaproteobacteria bacterium]
MKNASQIIIMTLCVFTAYGFTTATAQAQKPRPVYCENNGFAVLADEIAKAQKAQLSPALIATAKRRYERARRWRMRARAAECEGLLRNALNDLRQAATGNTATSTIGIVCDKANLNRLSVAINKGRKAKLNHALIRSVQSRYLIPRKLLAQNKPENCARQIATGLRTLKNAHASQAVKAQTLARGVQCNDSGFSALNAEMRVARTSDLSPKAINIAKKHYRKARRLRRKKNATACADRLNAGLKVIQEARK